MIDFFGTFRGRLLLIFAFLTIATLGVQYYLNLYMQNENEQRRALHDKAVLTGVTFGVSSITSGEYMTDMLADPDQASLDQESRERLRDIIIVNNYRQVTDSMNNPDLLPVQAPDGTTQY